MLISLSPAYYIYLQLDFELIMLHNYACVLKVVISIRKIKMGFERFVL